MAFVASSASDKDVHSSSELVSHHGSIKGWRPFYLRRRALWAFIISFCAIIIVLEVLNHVSTTNSGLASSVQSLHYSWTYGPTAVLTIIAALWARVEFQAKQIAPWQEMLNKPQAEANKSILLDYVSMLQPVSMIKALRNDHYVVASGVSCSLLLRLLIIFSTGLFSLQPTPIDIGEVQVQLSTSFDPFNGSAKLDSASSKAYDVLNAIIYKNATHSEGTNAYLAYQRASSAGLPSNSLVNSTVDSVAANLECEKATMNSANFSSHGQGILSTPTCSISMSFINVLERDLSVMSLVQPPRNCTNSDNKDDQRIAIFMGELQLAKSVPHNGPSSPLTNLTVSQSVQHLCKPIYSAQKLAVALNTTDSYSMKILQTTGAKSTLPNLTAIDIANQAFAYSDTYMKSPQPANDDKLFTGNNVSMDLSLTLGARLSGFDGTMKELFDQDMTVELFTNFYRAMTAQLIGESLLQPNRSETVGQAIVSQNRVLVTDVSLRAMEVCLVLMILLALIMTLPKLHYKVFPWNPSTIKAVASILSNNPETRDNLRGTGASSGDALSRCLTGRQYTLRETDRKVTMEVTSHNHNDLKPSDGSTAKYWRPFPNLFTRIGFFIILAGVIASLEGVLHVSQTKNGLGDVSGNAYTHYLWTLLPALAMVSIGLCFGSIDFNTRSLAPYASLKKKDGVDFRYLTTSNFMDCLSMMNVFNSIKLKEFAVLATTAATILGSMLTIVSSGLYSAVDTSSVSRVNFTRTTISRDSRVLSTEVSQDIQNGMSGMQTASEIINANLTFPRWTWGELAFPNMTFDKDVINHNTSGMFVDIIVPALRSSLDCQLRNSTELFANFTPVPKTTTSPYAGPTLLVNSTVLPCLESERTTSRQTQIKGAGMNLAVEGKYLPVGNFGSSTGGLCYLNGSSLQAMFKSNPAVNFNKNPVTYTWGQTTSDSLVNVMELACMDTPETVQTRVRLTLPSLTIDEEHPPVTIEETATRAENAFLPLSDSWYYLQSYDQSATGLDSFFQALVSGKYAIPQEYFSDPDKADAVAGAIKHQHRIIKAQQISQNAQLSANGTLDNAPLIGNVTNPSHLRLFQDATSTRILEALLATMLLLGVLSSTLLNTDDVLPKNPNSIAALSSLLTDSNFLDFFQYVPDPTDTKIGETVFSKSRFYLGHLSDGDHHDQDLVKNPLCYSNQDINSHDSNFTIYVDDYEGKPI